MLRLTTLIKVAAPWRTPQTEGTSAKVHFECFLRLRASKIEWTVS